VGLFTIAFGPVGMLTALFAGPHAEAKATCERFHGRLYSAAVMGEASVRNRFCVRCAAGAVRAAVPFLFGSGN
jgi:hypothetical protein